MSKADLQKAKEAKNDEFYTRLEDIEAEILQDEDYVRQLEDKTVYCNCDNPEWSNFFVFFKLHFKQLKLKKLITTHYNRDNTPSYKLEWSGEMLHDDMVNQIKTPLKGNGDFRSEECIEILKEADVVVSNPPFSLFSQYLSQLIEYNKKFIIIGNQNAITYKEIFPLIKDNKLWYGVSIHSGDRAFYVPDDYPLNASGCGIDTNTGRKYIRVKGVRWFTNIDHGRRHEPLQLMTMADNLKYNKRLKKKLEEDYGKIEYPHYDNYDAIEVPFTECIPSDYKPCWYTCDQAKQCPYALSEGMNKEADAICEHVSSGNMGVPITFLDKYNTDQFDIVRFGRGDDGKYFTYTTLENYNPLGLKAGVQVIPYFRIIIRHKM